MPWRYDLFPAFNLAMILKRVDTAGIRGNSSPFRYSTAISTIFESEFSRITLAIVLLLPSLSLVVIVPKATSWKMVIERTNLKIVAHALLE